MDIYEDLSAHTGAVILNSNPYFNSFQTIVTAPEMNLDIKDIKEIIWQIFSKFTVVDENDLKYSLNTLPDYSSLVCTHILENEYKERKLKNAIIDLGLHLFHESKGLGLVRYDGFGGYEFPYFLDRIINGKIVLKYLSN